MFEFLYLSFQLCKSNIINRENKQYLFRKKFLKYVYFFKIVDETLCHVNRQNALIEEKRKSKKEKRNRR